VLDIEYGRDNQIDITAATRISILNLSTMDSDLKKMAKKAASLKLAASFLRIPQAMRAAGFSDEDASNVSKQMHVRRALERLKQQQTDALPVGCTVSVPSRSPTATINGSSTTSSLSATLLSDEMIPSPPVLEEVRLTVGATTKADWWNFGSVNMERRGLLRLPRRSLGSPMGLWGNGGRLDYKNEI